MVSHSDAFDLDRHFPRALDSKGTMWDVSYAWVFGYDKTFR